MYYWVYSTGAMARVRNSFRAGMLWTLVAGPALVSLTYAQSTGGLYSLTSHSIAGGGGHSSGGTYSLEGTTGQNDAGSALSGGVYDVVGGFQSSAASDVVFGNGFE